MTNAEKNQAELNATLRALRFRSSISGLLRHATSERELAQGACRIAVEDIGYLMAWVGEVIYDEAKSVKPLSHAGKAEDYLENAKVTWSDSEHGRGPTGTAVRENRAVICRDFKTDEALAPWREKALSLGFLSSIALPLVVDKKAIGVFTLYQGQPNEFPPDEVALLEEVARDIAYGFDAIRSKKREQTVNHLKSQFLDTAAHELRTPITALSLLVQHGLMHVKKGLPVDISTLNRMSTQISRLSGLIEDLLNTSRLERGVLALRKKDVELVGLVSDCLDEFKDRAPKRHFAFLHPPQEIKMLIDPVRIEQVLSNLLDNALKYSPEDSPIEVKIEMNTNEVRVWVCDQGPGIPKERQDDVFSRFFRMSTNETLAHPGLGLGLFICKSIVELHEGTIGLVSDLGQGCKFHFELPFTVKQK